MQHIMQTDTLTMYSYMYLLHVHQHASMLWGYGEPGRSRTSHTVKINPEITVGISDKRMA